jgi:hypothetical protein
MTTLSELFTQYPPTPQIHKWKGASGQWYIHSIFSIYNLPELGACNYILARYTWNANGFRVPLYIGQGKEGRLNANHEKFKPAIELGANEVHICQLASSEQQRLDIETDLRREHPTPLNEQGTGIFSALAALNSSGGIMGALSPSPLFGSLSSDLFSLK